ncbi:MAG: hypothetical protein ACOYB4_07745 [Methyloceanibacter sp.]
MQVAWFRRSGVAAVVVLALLTGTLLQAAESGAPGELDKRTKPADAPQSQPGGLSDSAVRVLMTYAFSIIPAETQGPDGKPVKVDKSDPNKFLIPNEDARRVIRAATRSAYAEVCQLPELLQANYSAMMKGEEGKKVWSRDQMLMISALHMFSVSYFAGGVRITTSDEPEEGAPAGAAVTGEGAAVVSKSDAPPPASGQEAGTELLIQPKAPQCPPEQKQKVTEAINAYVQAAQAAQAPQAPAPKPAE